MQELETYFQTSSPQDAPSSEVLQKYLAVISSVRVLPYVEADSFDPGILASFEDLDAHFKNDDNRTTFSLATPLWNSLKDYVTEKTPDFTVLIKRSARAALEAKKTAMDRAVDILQPTCRGGLGGKAWHSSYKPSDKMADHFEKTLDKLSTTVLGKLEDNMNTLREVSRPCQPEQ